MKATLALTLVMLAAFSLLPLACSSGDEETEGRVINTKTGLKIETLKVGTGAPAKRGDLVEMRYTGWLKDGTKFDSSDDHKGEPFFFRLGQGKVIKGWDEGVVGMKVGGKRKLTIPSELGYGKQGQGKIPPDAELVFDVELVSIK